MFLIQNLIFINSLTHKYVRGRWVLIRTCGDNLRVATIKLRYVKLTATSLGRHLIDEIRYNI